MGGAVLGETTPPPPRGDTGGAESIAIIDNPGALTKESASLAIAGIAIDFAFWCFGFLSSLSLSSNIVDDGGDDGGGDEGGGDEAFECFRSGERGGDGPLPEVLTVSFAL